MVKVLGSQDATGGLSKNSFGERWSHRIPPWKPDYTMLKKKCSLRKRGKWGWKRTGGRAGRDVLIKFKLLDCYILHYILFRLLWSLPNGHFNDFTVIIDNT